MDVHQIPINNNNDKTLQQKSHQRNKYLGCAPSQIFGTLSQVHYIPETALTDYINLEKREKEDLPASKTSLTHPYNDLKTT